MIALHTRFQRLAAIVLTASVASGVFISSFNLPQPPKYLTVYSYKNAEARKGSLFPQTDLLYKHTLTKTDNPRYSCKNDDYYGLSDMSIFCTDRKYAEDPDYERAKKMALDEVQNAERNRQLERAAILVIGALGGLGFWLGFLALVLVLRWIMRGEKAPQ